MNSLAVLLFTLWCANAAFGATYFNEIQKEIVYGKTVKFCEYKGLRLLPVSVIKDYDDCMKCRCTNKGLSCASMTARYTVPDDSECISVSIGCKNRWVLKTDNKKQCPKKNIPKQMSAVGK